ncbi:MULTISPECIES: flavodoxin family protein [Methanosarcina]|uniref:Iron-sulfur flavoprotein n=3 Tax=Methanosarcina barkeri TaxID=2208 RepID=A0A0E3QTU4_METBA|nr:MULTISPECIES: flavodoxin family protein [Methanosarcina]AKB54157.1 Iron-sulfur flavoprotein [Methanosarcina barkeri MS]AKB57768.1 Iron-sulfur flavoprotein [Methanosarcina barkeri 227]AKJ38312.1 NADPH-dependent FMN reductase [Methanosarcina barkeri CM1]OED11253.1 iron-sulfur protein [Methanosarcina sp. A14]
MKILGINASPRGNESKTLQLVKSVLKGAESEGANVELIDLYKLHIEYCTGCGACYATGECPQIDDFEELFDRILNSDGIVFGAPNYINSVPAPMKAFFDRLSDAIHCQMLTGKFGCSVSTAGGSKADVVVEYMNSVLMNLGVTVVGGLGVAVGMYPSALEQAAGNAEDLGKKLAKSIRGDIKYPDKDEMHRQTTEYFCQLVKSDKERFAHDYDWYVQKGLIK